MPSAAVKLRKKGRSNGAGAVSGLVTYGPYTSAKHDIPLKYVVIVVGVQSTP
ncbi:MAG TPA: hypothetical protein VHZ05_13770 [Acidimicrobiales bacterium]|nr:hypothetical protein [Acidimicrobiales bacterium]